MAVTVNPANRDPKPRKSKGQENGEKSGSRVMLELKYFQPSPKQGEDKGQLSYIYRVILIVLGVQYVWPRCWLMGNLA